MQPRPLLLLSASALASFAISAACSTIDPAQGGPLDGGDAAWDRPPLTPPGADGTPPANGEYGEDGGTNASSGDPGGGTTGSADSGWTETSADSTGGDIFMCLPGGQTACNIADGVCEAAPLPADPNGTTGSSDTGTDTASTDDPGSTDTGAPPPAEPSPCCEDLDCACDTSDCSLAPCQADRYCDCACPSDPDCGEGACDGKSSGPPPISAPPKPPVAAECPATADPIVLYMSNDDSNSQASPTYARRIIHEGGVVDPFRVRIHEFLNYYDLSYDNPGAAPATVGVQMRRIDRATGEFVLLLFAQGQQLADADRRPINLVFSLDTSGSMAGEALDQLKATMHAVAGSLREGDVVSIVSWSDTQSVLLESHFIAGPDDPTLVAAIASLEAGGSTDLSAGLITAYELAEAHYGDDRINRVMLISDGGANTGETDEQLIGDAAGDRDGEGIYMIGVGVGEAHYYDDALMDVITDKGKGAYLFIDSPAEAERSFGEHFLRNLEVAARDVQMQLTLPWYFGIKEFHGEEYSADPAEVEPQHLAPNDAMSYHQTIQSCDPAQILTTDTIKAKATFKHPISHEELSSELTVTIGDVVEADATQLYKADVIVAFAQALIVIGDLKSKADDAGAKQVALDMTEWLGTAATTLADPEVVEMRDLMALYSGNL